MYFNKLLNGEYPICALDDVFVFKYIVEIQMMFKDQQCGINYTICL